MTKRPTTSTISDMPFTKTLDTGGAAAALTMGARVEAAGRTVVGGVVGTVMRCRQAPGVGHVASPRGGEMTRYLFSFFSNLRFEKNEGKKAVGR